MSTYVLVHGAWHGAWCWKRVRKILQTQGHDLFTPTLTGVADRSHLLSREVNLDTHINDVLNLIRWEELSDVILCGHSYGGCVISGVADRIPDRIGALVYLDAFVLESGERLLQLVHEPQRTMLLEGAKNTGDGWKVPPIPGEVFKVNSRDLAWMNQQCTMHPLACFEQPLKLRQGIQKIKNAIFVRATGWDDSPFLKSCERAKAKGWKTVTMPYGHDVMLDAPVVLAKLLVETAPRAASAG
jgi:pimeloyl-ACP methyl ester carboxylesterase